MLVKMSLAYKNLFVTDYEIYYQYSVYNVAMGSFGSSLTPVVLHDFKILRIISNQESTETLKF